MKVTRKQLIQKIRRKLKPYRGYSKARKAKLQSMSRTLQINSKQNKPSSTKGQQTFKKAVRNIEQKAKRKLMIRRDKALARRIRGSGYL